MAFERYEVVKPPISELRELIRAYTHAPDSMELPRITVTAQRIGLIALNNVAMGEEWIELDMQVIGAQSDETGSHVYGTTGTNPISTIDITVADAPEFPAILSVPVPKPPADMVGRA